VSRTLRTLARIAAFLVAVALVAVAGFSWWVSRPLPLPSSPYSFEVRAGMTLKSVAHEMVGAGMLRFEFPLVALARYRRVDRSIKAGNYEIVSGVTLASLLDKLTQGDVMQAALTIVEGSTVADLAQALATSPAIVKSVSGLPEAELAQRIGVPGGRLEGWFFPDTYYFATGSPDLALLTRAHRLMQRRLDAAWSRRAPDSPLKEPYSALILASIVEKETGRAADRPLIASVFLNRLRLGMRLQSDPTVIYGMGASFDGNLRKRDLETDTSYNTYTRDGLPPTPIALPGQASLEAVVNPPKTDFLYFVSRGDGTSEFSTNLSDHNRAVARFQAPKR
jgi:UPF0755 protein